MKDLQYDFMIASISGMIGYIFVPEKKIVAALLFFLLALISQKRGWIGP